MGYISVRAGTDTSTMKEAPSMENRRYDYQPIIRWKKIRWPNGARIALWVCPNIEYFHIDKAIPAALASHLPDIQGYTLRDYGSRVCVFCLLDVFFKHGVQGGGPLH